MFRDIRSRIADYQNRSKARFAMWLTAKVNPQAWVKKQGIPALGERFMVDGGDGDQSFFGEPKVLRLIEADWFPGRLLFGEALLFVVDEGPLAGTYVALTARGMSSLAKNLTELGWSSVVVHLIRNPTESFDAGGEDADAIGMSYVERL